MLLLIGVLLEINDHTSRINSTQPWWLAGSSKHLYESTVEPPGEGDAEPVTCKPSQSMQPEQKWQLSCSLTWAIAALCLLSVFASR